MGTAIKLAGAGWKLDAPLPSFLRLGTGGIYDANGMSGERSAAADDPQGSRIRRRGGTGDAAYGDSGVMSFMVNEQGVVFEKNLGPNTAALARAIEQYDPDASWRVPAD